MKDFDYEQLDPGIRDLVRAVHAAGFETTDSGDGVTKKEWIESGEAMPFPHIVCNTSPGSFFMDAERLALLLGDEWEVEAVWYVVGGTSHLFARPKDEKLQELRG